MNTGDTAFMLIATAMVMVMTPGLALFLLLPCSGQRLSTFQSVIGYLAVVGKSKLGYDDSLDVVGVHGVGGIWGALATGIFASSAVNLAGKGVLDGNAHQLTVQAIGVGTAIVYSVEPLAK